MVTIEFGRENKEVILLLHGGGLSLGGQQSVGDGWALSWRVLHELCQRICGYDK